MRVSMATWLIALLLALTGCEAIGDIFSAGVYTGLAIVVLVIIVIVWIVRSMNRRG